MSFTITITETREVKYTNKPWVVLSSTKDKSGIEKDERGYAPEYESSKTESFRVFEQSKETLDLAAVIKAVNGL